MRWRANRVQHERRLSELRTAPTTTHVIVCRTQPMLRRRSVVGCCHVSRRARASKRDTERAPHYIGTMRCSLLMTTGSAPEAKLDLRTHARFGSLTCRHQRRMQRCQRRQARAVQSKVDARRWGVSGPHPQTALPESSRAQRAYQQRNALFWCEELISDLLRFSFSSKRSADTGTGVIPRLEKRKGCR
jgi:hypothetical protein